MANSIPKILLLVKRSTYEHYLTIAEGSPVKLKELIPSSDIKRFKITHDIHYQSLVIVEQILSSFNLNYKIHYRGTSVNYKAFSLIITLGGDGTFLEAAQWVTTQNILGVNSNPNWSVGRFCACDAKHLNNVIKRYLIHKATIQSLQRIELAISGVKRKYHVLNDVLICHVNPAALSRYRLSINSKSEDQRSSGVWISTAAGSSGAMLSAGGTLMSANSCNFQYKPRELYKGFGFNYQLTGGILKPTDKFKIASLMREGKIYIDGSHIRLPFTLGMTATLKPSRFPLQAIWK